MNNKDFSIFSAMQKIIISIISFMGFLYFYNIKIVNIDTYINKIKKEADIIDKKIKNKKIQKQKQKNTIVKNKKRIMKKFNISQIHKEVRPPSFKQSFIVDTTVTLEDIYNNKLIIQKKYNDKLKRFKFKPQLDPRITIIQKSILNDIKHLRLVKCYQNIDISKLKIKYNIKTDNNQFSTYVSVLTESKANNKTQNYLLFKKIQLKYTPLNNNKEISNRKKHDTKQLWYHTKFSNIICKINSRIRYVDKAFDFLKTKQNTTKRKFKFNFKK